MIKPNKETDDWVVEFYNASTALCNVLEWEDLPETERNYWREKFWTKDGVQFGWF